MKKKQYRVVAPLPAHQHLLFAVAQVHGLKLGDAFRCVNRLGAGLRPFEQVEHRNKQDKEKVEPVQKQLYKDSLPVNLLLGWHATSLDSVIPAIKSNLCQEMHSSLFILKTTPNRLTVPVEGCRVRPGERIFSRQGWFMVMLRSVCPA